ncbi:methylmalonyl mutase, putative [Babesia ovata]|uniref:Methylmalonyl mutase, putative n=1 Tax=Babesia ovata TaxID=189622 RepID=A0A2H6KFJ0_9APIC|nr:methylmalonyl mutase, putative [Babesia ovata]GBE61762.1 methylmalonyl mutase, putative [Babesia ovata]
MRVQLLELLGPEMPLHHRPDDDLFALLVDEAVDDTLRDGRDDELLDLLPDVDGHAQGLQVLLAVLGDNGLEVVVVALDQEVKQLLEDRVFRAAEVLHGRHHAEPVEVEHVGRLDAPDAEVRGGVDVFGRQHRDGVATLDTLLPVLVCHVRLAHLVELFRDDAADVDLGAVVQRPVLHPVVELRHIEPQ